MQLDDETIHEPIYICVKCLTWLVSNVAAEGDACWYCSKGTIVKLLPPVQGKTAKGDK
jgi:hypothetical protein